MDVDPKNSNITEPCILCRENRIPIGQGKYCLNCYKELLANIILKE